MKYDLIIIGSGSVGAAAGYYATRAGLNVLISVHNADLNVVLTTPASRCLSLLLEAFPDVVAQQDFFTRVWEEEGMRVPTNTLYQNISIIRRGFRAVGDTTHSLNQPWGYLPKPEQFGW